MTLYTSNLPLSADMLCIIESTLFCRHDGLIVLATNRPYDLDEAMHRRIMIAIEFRQPDHLLRKAIWESHIPSQMQLKDDIDLVRQHAAYRLKFRGFCYDSVNFSWMKCSLLSLL